MMIVYHELIEEDKSSYVEINERAYLVMFVPPFDHGFGEEGSGPFLPLHLCDHLFLATGLCQTSRPLAQAQTTTKAPTRGLPTESAIIDEKETEKHGNTHTPNDKRALGEI